MRENLKSGSVRGLIVTPELLLQKGVAMSSTRHTLCAMKKFVEGFISTSDKIEWFGYMEGRKVEEGISI
jgi:hypothetical protein